MYKLNFCSSRKLLNMGYPIDRPASQVDSLRVGVREELPVQQLEYRCQNGSLANTTLAFTIIMYLDPQILLYYLVCCRCQNWDGVASPQVCRVPTQTDKHHTKVQLKNHKYPTYIRGKRNITRPGQRLKERRQSVSLQCVPGCCCVASSQCRC